MHGIAQRIVVRLLAHNGYAKWAERHRNYGLHQHNRPIERQQLRPMALSGRGNRSCALLALPSEETATEPLGLFGPAFGDCRLWMRSSFRVQRVEFVAAHQPRHASRHVLDNHHGYVGIGDIGDLRIHHSVVDGAIKEICREQGKGRRVPERLGGATPVEKSGPSCTGVAWNLS